MKSSSGSSSTSPTRPKRVVAGVVPQVTATSAVQRQREAEQYGRITTEQALNAAAHYLASPVCEERGTAHRPENVVPCAGCLAAALELVHRGYEHLRKRRISK